MRVIGIRADRDDRKYYFEKIKNAKKSIDVMGVTGNRFINHFSDFDGREESKVLIRALEQGVLVRMLLPKLQYLENDKQRQDAQHSFEVFNKLKQHSGNFDFKYFEHTPAHSIFIIDKECIVGPVFPTVSSKDTPSIHLYTDSPFAEKYTTYFESEWEKGAAELQ